MSFYLENNNNTMDDITGEKVLDRYQIMKMIGSGKSSNVYLATNTTDATLVVIKVINKLTLNNYKLKIKRDSQIPLLAFHPSVIKIKDFGEDECTAYIVYEHLPGAVSLGKKLNVRLINFVEDKENFNYAIKMMIQVCEGLEHLHSKNIIHRDIKPENIIVNQEKAMIIDFGLSSVNNSREFPTDSRCCGTILFFAPEIFTRHKIDYKLVDIYAFGVTLYYLFNKGKFHYDVITPSELEYSHRNRDAYIPSNSGYPALDQLIMRIIDYDQFKRPKLTTIKNSLLQLLEQD